MLQFGFIADFLLWEGVSSKRRGGEETHLLLKCRKTRDETGRECLDNKWPDVSAVPTPTQLLTDDVTCEKFR